MSEANSSTESDQLDEIDPEQVTVAIFCALAEECVAIRYTLDEEYSCRGKIKGPRKYAYTFGRIRDHKLVIARQTEMGPVKAAQCASTVSQQFVNVRFALMVGIGGGIPNPPQKDIRLGDVAVSAPRNDDPGVLQYDLGKFEAEGVFKLKGCLTKPPAYLISADNSLQEDELMDKNTIKKIVSHIITKNYRFRRPTKPDVLYRDDFQHVEAGADCTACESATGHNKIPRSERSKPHEPVVHRGLILSGGGVVKTPEERERLQRGKSDAICFEMEAAGIMDEIPCLVIRGICDYADTHKQDGWHFYASAVAAAYAKAILRKVEPEDVAGSETMQAILEIGRGVEDVQTRVRGLEAAADRERRDQILEWLEATNYGWHLSDIYERRHPGTGQWFLTADDVQTWIQEDGATLFCPGVPGAGKSMLAAVLVKELQSFIQQQEIAIVHIFCNYEKRDEQTLSHMLATLIKQLLQQDQSGTPVTKAVVDLHSIYERYGTRPTVTELLHALQLVSQTYRKIYVVVDGLDECDCRGEFLKAISDLADNESTCALNLMVTSRPFEDVVRYFKGSPKLEIRADMDDLSRYASDHLSQAFEKESWGENLLGRSILKSLENSDGMFLLVKLRLDAMLEQVTKGSLSEMLQTLPENISSLDRAYCLTLKRIQDQGAALRSLADQALMWVLHAKEPLAVSGLRFVLANPQIEMPFETAYVPDTQKVLEACKGLLTVDEESQRFKLIHQTTREFLEKRSSAWFPNAQWNITKTCAISLMLFFNEKVASEGLMPMHKYGTRYWGSHALHLEEQPQELIKLLKNKSITTQLYAHTKDNSERYEPRERNVRLYLLTKFWKRPHRAPVDRVTGPHLAALLDFHEGQASFLNSFKIDNMDSAGRTPLSYACSHGNLGMARYLVDRGADVNHQCKLGRTPLHCAAQTQRADVVQFLIEHGADLEVRDSSGMTPLILSTATKHGDITTKRSNARDFALDPKVPYNDIVVIIKLLLNTANTDATCIRGRTALSYAVERQSPAAVRMLLGRNVNTSGKPESGKKPLENYRADKNALAKPTRVDPVDSSWWLKDWTPLLYAIKRGDVGITAALLDTEADVNHRNADSWTQLMQAVDQRRLDLIMMLTEKGGSLTPRNHKGQTALHLAAKRRSTDNASFWRPNTSSHERRGLNPEIAVRAILSYLIREGADLDVEDKQGNTPRSLMLAGGIDISGIGGGRVEDRHTPEESRINQAFTRTYITSGVLEVDGPQRTDQFEMDDTDPYTDEEADLSGPWDEAPSEDS